jgi:very-short-patch-repair endonuclease
VVSHRSAGAWLDLRASARGHVDVTVPRRGGRRDLDGIDVHTSRLDPADLTVHEGVPVTTVARTLVDLAGALPFDALRRAVEQALIARTFDTDAMNAAIARAGRRPGAGNLRATLAAIHDEPPITRSELERRFDALCTAAGLRSPILNAAVRTRQGVYEVDAHWPRQRLIVELDGWSIHGTRAAFERDRRRDAALVEAGWLVLRFTWRQVIDEPRTVVATLRAAGTR